MRIKESGNIYNYENRKISFKMAELLFEFGADLN